MVQLIKLQDYVSRYEMGIYQYPSQFIRLKKEKWSKMQQMFEQGLWETDREEPVEIEPIPTKGISQFFKKNKSVETDDKKVQEVEKMDIPKTVDELKHHFLDGLFPFQLKWATTTLREKSFVDDYYRHDDKLTRLLQRIPDTYFLMYHPIVELRKAKMEAETILIGPSGIEIIHELNFPAGTRIHPTSEKSWYAEHEGKSSRFLTPIITLKRTESYVKSVLGSYQLDFPYRLVILAPELTIQGASSRFQTDYIDRERYEGWLQEKRKISSPLKHTQLKAAEALLKHCQTTSVRRPEWDMEKEIMEE
ncbi:hypothetical protein [Halobacillus sp. BBL2006]|uniref:hypothetical protein n=1 Tax=Halobacillus sp. BBL2006 TaxID=1543706 RepID=UPI0005432678|nr:hypothetical protein [Halobacillus sp. BBL2006]KHE69084.1 hypothetical protein LD39_13435 [Halobacillus sp. BBL2006]